MKQGSEKAATINGAGIEVVMPREGGPEVLRVGRRERQIPKAGEAVVRVEAAGVSFAEVQMLKGRYFGQPRFPFVPGYDLVGMTWWASWRRLVRAWTGGCSGSAPPR